MSDSSKQQFTIPPEQQAIRDKCFHPSGTFVEFPMDDVETSIPARFAKIVRKYPERIAMQVHDEQITYDELDNVSNRIAHSLLEMGGDRDEPIVILMSDGIEAASAIFGILKAGRFYIQLPPSFSQQGLLSILKNSEAKVIISEKRGFSLLDDFAANECTVLNIDDLLQGPSNGDIGLSILPSSLCSIRYTTGTTGEPKGVMHSHRKVLHAAMVNTSDLHLCYQDRCAAHGHDYFNPLLVGASFHLNRIAEHGWTQFSNWLIKNEITTYDTVPGLFRQFCSTLTGNQKFPHLRLIKLEGESALKQDVQFYKKYFSDSCVLVNRLGTRETGGFRQLFVDKATSISNSTLPAGYAVGAKEIILLNDDGSQVQDDRPGEITVISPYLSSGYWHRQDLTDISFVPVAGDTNRVKYRTGDLGWFCPDGCLEYIGRKDDQIKLGGQKVHPAEIEAALIDCKGVKAAVVKSWQLNFNEPCLTAYLVTADIPKPSVRELRRSLRKSLPDYKVPSRFVFLDAFSIGPTGKIDRSALPRPDHSRPELPTPYTESRTSIEQMLSSIWADVLVLDKVGIHDDFFDLGGHSLSAMRIVHRVVQAFKSELPISTLFDAPTVAEMAAVIKENLAKPATEEEMARMIREIEEMAEDEAEKQLTGQKTRS